MLAPNRLLPLCRKRETHDRRCGVTEGMIHSYSLKNSHCVQLFSRKMQYFCGISACVQIVHTPGNKLYKRWVLLLNRAIYGARS